MASQILFHELLTIQIPNTKIAKELHYVCNTITY